MLQVLLINIFLQHAGNLCLQSAVRRKRMNIQLLSEVFGNIPWIFDGIGTEIVCAIISLLVGALGGGLVGYRIGVKNQNKLSQKAGDYASQQQAGSVNINNEK